ncbi:hypothetical protein [Paenibacillus qinlingensis]|uniref:hypothetical protein n=1 Tax=Paenibacillus qinlingensis TaxID=1837343 RepID=UPI001563AFCB|nr:hypothetical protein [Paenibacillus qinlingensis]NQX57515.1 hypothetical protein [Paenibacillus qinlingensis]
MYKIKFLSLLLLFICLVGCNSSATNPTNPEKNANVLYVQFSDQFHKFKDSYSSNNFLMISPKEKTVLTTSFPPNTIDTRKSDTVSDDIQQPTKLELYFKGNKFPVLFQVSFMYFPSSEDAGFVAVNSMSDNDNFNILKEYQDIMRPREKELLVSFKGYLVSIKCISTKNNLTEHEISEFNQNIVEFYSEFENLLLAAQKGN